MLMLGRDQASWDSPYGITAEYKLRIVREADALRAVAMWVRCCAARVCIPRSCRAGVTNARRLLRAGMTASTRGRKAKMVDSRIKELERENAQLRRRLQRADIIIDIQKKSFRVAGDPP